MKKLSYLVVLAMLVSIIGSMSIAPVSAADVNLLASHDPSFETSAWSPGVQTDAGKATGLYSMELLENTAASLWVNDVPLKPSTQYTLSYYFKTFATDYNRIVFGIVLKAGGKAVPDMSQEVNNNMPNFTKKTFTFNTPANLDLKVDAWNNLGLQISTSGKIFVDDVSLVEVGPVADSVTINKVSDTNATISGKTSPASSCFILWYGFNSKAVKSDSNGVWSVKFAAPLKVGTEISLMSKASKFLVVPATAPTVSSITSKSKSITGKTYKFGVVTIKIGAKSYSVKASNKGAFKKTLTKTLKKGSKFSVKVKSAGQTSPIKTVTVK